MRIEIGPRDVSNGTVVLSRRDVPGKQGKMFGISMDPSVLESLVQGKLDDIQTSLLKKAIEFRDRYIFFKPDSSCYFTVSFETAAFCTGGKVYFLWGIFRNIVDVSSYNELKAAISEGKWARGPWSARYVVLYPLFPCIIISELSMPYTGYQWP